VGEKPALPNDALLPGGRERAPALRDEAAQAPAGVTKHAGAMHRMDARDEADLRRAGVIEPPGMEEEPRSRRAGGMEPPGMQDGARLRRARVLNHAPAEDGGRAALELDAYWLPGLQADEVAEWQTPRFGARDEVRLRVPVLTPAGLAAVMERAAAARDAYLAETPVAQVAASIDRAVSRWLDPYSRWRRLAERALPAITGYSAPMVRKGLPGYLATFRRENLWRMLEAELGTPGYLDGFQPRGRLGGRSRAYGPRLATHVFAGNVPGLPAQSLVAALLAKAACLGKAASEEPLFPALFAASLAEVDRRLGACLAVAWWPGGTTALEDVAFRQADAVIAYGSEATIVSIRARVPPETRLVAYNHQLSFGVVGREARTPVLRRR
jgi:hypothetical protein